MTALVRLPVRQGTPEWLDARRGLISSTDIPVILGLSPYKSEGQLAREKLGQAEPSASTPLMRAGLFMEAFVAEEYTALTGRRLRRIRNMLQHPRIEWAAASIDREVVGDRRLVEIKSTSSKRYEDEMPQDTEAQVRWALGVSGYPVADVAVWVHGAKEPLRVEPIAHDPDIFDGLVKIAEDFRRRLADGGPFAENAAAIRALYPADDGTEGVADAETAEAVMRLLDLRTQRKELEEAEEVIEVALKARMGEMALLTGPGFRVTWKRTKDREETNWRQIADGLLRTMPETEAKALVGLHTTVSPGFRPLRVVRDKEAVG